MKLILLGAPGAGKGTQAEILCKELNIPTISTGNILRAAIKNGTPTGLKAKAFMDEGKLAEDAAKTQNMYEKLFCKQYQAYLNGEAELANAPYIANLLAVAGSKKFDVPVEVVKAMVELGAELNKPATVTPLGDTAWNLAIEHGQVHLLLYHRGKAGGFRNGRNDHSPIRSGKPCDDLSGSIHLHFQQGRFSGGFGILDLRSVYADQ